MPTLVEQSVVAYSEKKVAEKIGLTRAEIAFARKKHLHKTVDWLLVDRQIALTQCGLARVVGMLPEDNSSIDFADCLIIAPAPEKNGGADEALAPPAPIELAVIRRCANVRMLLCRAPGPREVYVRVKCNANFVPGMALRGRPSTVTSVWEMEGPCPRRKGRY